MPRTYATKPEAAVDFWEKRDLHPRRVNTLDLIRRRAEYILQKLPPRGRGRVYHGDIRSVSLPYDRKFTHVITSPPYLGMRCYVSDQWLRNWFLGARDDVHYDESQQLGSRNPKVFLRELGQVWRRGADLQRKILVGTRFAVTHADTGEEAMRVRLFFVLVLLFALASSGLAQVDHPLIKNSPDAPFQIIEAHCGKSERLSASDRPPMNYCQAKLQFAADSKETWDGYGLIWTLTYEDGSKEPLYHSSNRSIELTGRLDGSTQPSGRFFKPGEIVNAGYPGAGFGKRDRNGKGLRVTDAQVEVEFVVNTNGTVWGDSKSPGYLQMVPSRKQAKGGAKEGTP